MSANSTATIKTNEKAVEDSTAYVADDSHEKIHAEVISIDAQIEALQKARADMLKPVRDDMEALNVSKIVDVSGATLFTLTTANRTTLDSKGIRENCPDIAEQFSKTATVTTFKVSK